MSLPDWVLKHKQKNTEIKFLNNRYYLYKITSKWDKIKKRAQKQTVEFLGTITLGGLISRQRKYAKQIKQQNDPQNLNDNSNSTATNSLHYKIAVKEYGASKTLITEFMQEIQPTLQKIFQDDWQYVFVISILRMIYQCPFKSMERLYNASYLSNAYPNLKMSGKDMSRFINKFGQRRTDMVNFMHNFVTNSSNIVFDVTSIISHSEKLEINQVGYNSKKEYDPQVNLMYIFSVDKKQPIYYRVIPGNIREVNAFKLSVEESEVKNAVVIADKGFASSDNINMLKSQQLNYIIPLKRNSNLINYHKIIEHDYAKFDGFFFFQKRHIWHYKYTQENQEIYIFYDEYLKVQENNDYLSRITSKYEGYQREEFFNTHSFGTIAMTIDQPHAAELIIFDNTDIDTRVTQAAEQNLDSATAEETTDESEITRDEIIVKHVAGLTFKTETAIISKYHNKIYYHDKKQLLTFTLDKKQSIRKLLFDDKLLITSLEIKNALDAYLGEKNLLKTKWYPAQVYFYYKSRMQIETSFDTYKNVFLSDKTYMQSQTGLESWMFFNHIVLMVYYKLYKLLVDTNLISKYSPLDIIEMLRQVKTLNINNEWITSEIPQKLDKLLKKLQLHIPY